MRCQAQFPGLNCKAEIDNTSNILRFSPFAEKIRDPADKNGLSLSAPSVKLGNPRVRSMARCLAFRPNLAVNSVTWVTFLTRTERTEFFKAT